MLKPKYIVDTATGVVKKSVVTLKGFVTVAAKYLLAASVLALLWYVLFALFFSTDVEKKLKAENKFYEQVYPRMKEDLYLLGAVVKGLDHRDVAIYESIFHNSVPTGSDFDIAIAGDDAPDTDVASFTSSKLQTALEDASRVDENFQRTFRILLDEGGKLPPMSAPIKDFSSIRAGASAGVKTSPFLKMEVSHDGFDIIAPSGTDVLATADGTVLSVTRSTQGHGNMVSVRHDGGYVTRYGNLGSISVRKDERVRRGTKIGTVGMSGISYAPHVHYEIIRDTLVCDPARYMFASVTPEDYADLAFVSASTGQSLD